MKSSLRFLHSIFFSVGVKMHHLPQPTMSKLQDSQFQFKLQKHVGNLVEVTHISTTESVKAGARIPLYEPIRTPKCEGTMDKKHM
jgi:hypothetical protein